jgi:putative ABC transport system ATP-binding protein
MTIARVENLVKIYAREGVPVRALNGATVGFERGEFTAIMGPSGSGKSTLMHILGCLDTPTEGSYFLGDTDTSLYRDNELSELRAAKLGFVFQTFNLVPQLTVLENVEVPLFYLGTPRRERRRVAMDRAEQVGLGHRVGHRPQELSGGERQRAAIARSLVNNPLLVLADEPTGNLDTVTGTEIMKLFVRLNKEGTTIIMVTHDRNIAGYARRVVTLIDGRIVSDEAS